MDESAGAVPEKTQEKNHLNGVECLNKWRQRDNGESFTSGDISIYRRLRRILGALIIAVFKLSSFCLPATWFSFSFYHKKMIQKRGFVYEVVY